MEASDTTKRYLYEIQLMTNFNKRIEEMFFNIPDMSVEHYQRTAFIYANKKYETELGKDEPVPHGFYQILEDSICNAGFITTIKKYREELSLICQTLNIDEKELRNILKELRPSQNKGAAEIQAEQKARQELKQIFRKFNSVFKENYVKDIVSKKMEMLQDSIISGKSKKIKKVLTPLQFVRYIFDNKILLDRLRNLISSTFYVYPTDAMMTSILMATTKKNYSTSMSNILRVKEPDSYDKYLAERHIRRLENNFAGRLEKMTKDFSLEEKEAVLRLIKYHKKCFELDMHHNSDEYNQLKMMVKKGDMDLLLGIAKLMRKSNTDLKLVDGEFQFIYPTRITASEKVVCEKHKEKLNAIKKLHNKLFNLYNKQNNDLLEFMNESNDNVRGSVDVEIDGSKWLDSEKIKKLISKIDIDAINKMPDRTFNALKKFLIKDGLLWVYLADNIKSSMVAKIVNNFESIYASMIPTDISIENIQEIVKKANLYDYVDDYTIALVGLDNLAKIINYNQFLGVAVTDEIIRKRIRKVVDLTLRSENMDKSSLPFTCDIRTENYSLLRYRNNDPDIFTSGIDTKTCFCVGVNENDFFFYSLLNKDGYVIKIVDKDNKLVARASCFRRNNVLMINGIRFLNNKVIPENQEELEQFREIIELIKLMARKMISITSEDKCPIDYVVCNQAGLLENAYFEEKFEKVNSQLFREPINIYNDEWQEFVHMYDGEEEQLLQEVPSDPEHSFTTDFGNHYPALLIESRNNMGLFSPRDISLGDQEAIYRRPRRMVAEYIGEEINEDILSQINRLRALDYGRRLKDKEELPTFTLFTDIAAIDKVCIGDDWCIIMLKNGNKMPFYSRYNRTMYNEANQYVSEMSKTEEKDVKIYTFPDSKKLQ